jgi:hypothetical protein
LQHAKEVEMAFRNGVLATLTAGALAVVGLTVSTIAQGKTSHAAPKHITISTAGVGTWARNGFFKETVHFVHPSYTIASGGTITFEKGKGDKTLDPHTLTVVKPSQLPRSPRQIEECLGDAPGTPCTIGDSATGPISLNGKPGLSEPGQNLSITPGPYGVSKGVTVTVTAPPGTTLHFMCSVHPWMQAVLHVVK